jgi:hypothetical protein
MTLLPSFDISPEASVRLPPCKAIVLYQSAPDPTLDVWFSSELFHPWRPWRGARLSCARITQRPCTSRSRSGFVEVLRQQRRVVSFDEVLGRSDAVGEPMNHVLTEVMTKGNEAAIGRVRGHDVQDLEDLLAEVLRRQEDVRDVAIVVERQLPLAGFGLTEQAFETHSHDERRKPRDELGEDAGVARSGQTEIRLALVGGASTHGATISASAV